MALTAPAIPASGSPAVNNTGQNASVTWAGGTTQAMYALSPEVPLPAVITPAVPATTVAFTNASGVPQLVQIGANGATISAVTVNGTGVGTAAGFYVVPAAGTIAITYTVATPTWTWTPVAWAVAGAGGNITAGSVAIRVPPSGSLVPVYTVVPTSWTWADPQDLSGEPEVASENQAAINQTGQLPLPAHAEGGETGLGEAVSN
jgi:hypothetical protein